jgi:RimJ/RimL family protein N-acetyltransferase
MGTHENEAPIVNIVGERIALGPHRRDLVPVYLRWINDFYALRTLGVGAPGPTTLEKELEWYDGLAKSGDIHFTIYERATWRPIGTTRLGSIDYRNRTAVFGINIGEASERGKGFGTEATILLLDYAFSALGLHSVMLTVAGYNLAGQRAYAKAGFKEFGRRRQCRLLAGEFWDDIFMDCLATEFEPRGLAKIFAPDVAR